MASAFCVTMMHIILDSFKVFFIIVAITILLIQSPNAFHALYGFPLVNGSLVFL